MACALWQVVSRDGVSQPVPTTSSIAPAGAGCWWQQKQIHQALQPLPCPPSTLPLLYLFMFQQKHNTNKARP